MSKLSNNQSGQVLLKPDSQDRAIKELYGYIDKIRAALDDIITQAQGKLSIESRQKIVEIYSDFNERLIHILGSIHTKDKQTSSNAQPPRGTTDVLETDLVKREYILSSLASTCRNWGFLRIDTPTFEHTDTFSKAHSLIPEKSYLFSDKAGRSLVLRSDINAPITRAVINNQLMDNGPQKLFFHGKVFRYRHQKRREFQMFGIETYGIKDPRADAEIISLLTDALQRIGFAHTKVRYNNLGIYFEIIKSSLKGNTSAELISELLHKLRLAKNRDERAFYLTEYGITGEYRDFLLQMLNATDDTWENQYALLSTFRGNMEGLDPILNDTKKFDAVMQEYGIGDTVFSLSQLHGVGFYSGLTYQVFSADLQHETADGGRYDNLVESLGGRNTPATGLGLGIERLTYLADSKGLLDNLSMKQEGVLVVNGLDHNLDLKKILFSLRENGIRIEEVGNNQKKIIRYAESKRYRSVVYIRNSHEDTKIYDIDIIRFSKDSNNELTMENVKTSVLAGQLSNLLADYAK